MLGDRHRRLIQVTLQAAAPYGAALGGRNALAVHGLSGQATKQIDVVTSRDTVPEAAAAVQAALRRAGYRADRQPLAPELENTWPGGRDTAVQWHVRQPGSHDHPPIGGVTGYQCPACFDRDHLGLSRAPRSRDPVPTDLGPVLHPEDAAGQKVADLARRGRVRDYAAAADLLEHYSPADLIGFARRLDPSLDRRDLANLARRLDEYPDIVLTALGALEPEDVPRLRDRFAGWPRDARQIGRPQDARHRQHADPSRDTGDLAASRHEHREPGQPASQPRDLADGRQPHRAEPARPQPATAPRPPPGRTSSASRPSLSWAVRRFGSWRQYATFLGWAQGWAWRWRVYAHLESLILMIAAPQEGKTQAAAGMVIDAPGAVVAPSIRGDLIRATAGLRLRAGRIHVWDPEQAGGYRSTIRWNLVHGCAGIATAVRRAGSMVEAVTARGLDGEAFWNDQASMVLAALLHAAALAAADGGPGFDFADFVTSTGALYLVAADSATSPVPPLFAAIIAELTHAAWQTGTASPAGRLDPPLTAVLDEVANIAPVPVPAWASWAAGSGIRLVLIAQSYAQLKQRWGAEGAAVIWQCCKTKIIFGGTTEDELAALTERACGTVRVRTTDRHQDRKWRGHEEIPLLPAAALRMLPPGRAVVIQGRAAPAIVRIEQARRRADYKRHHTHQVPAALPATARQLPEGAPPLPGRTQAGLASSAELTTRPDQLAAVRHGAEEAREEALP